MNPLRVAVGQFNSTPNPSENLAIIEEFVLAAAQNKVKLLVLPEAAMACFGTKLVDIAQPLTGEFASRIIALAKQTEIFIVAGMFTPEKLTENPAKTPPSNPRVHNTLIATGGEGLAHYHKIHLFDALGQQESKYVAPGNELVLLDALGIKIGLATCFDIRFANHFTSLGKAGAQIICLSASWAAGPEKSQQWQMLIRARAHDSQAWLLAADQAWKETAEQAALGNGLSAIVAPDGKIVASLGKKPGIVFHDIDLDLVTKVRRQLPLLASPKTGKNS